MSYGQHASKTYNRRCDRGHWYNTGDQAARFTTAKGTARYFCPVCLAAGEKPPKGWHKAKAAGQA